MIQRTWPYWLGLTLAAVLALGCQEAERSGNPLDPTNPLTAGSPPGLIAQPGDASATLRWYSWGMTGIRAYRIYRWFEGDPTREEVLIAEIPAAVDSATGQEPLGYVYTFTDTGLQNDPQTPDGVPIPYRYRLAAVDANGVETPAPESLTPEERLQLPTASVTPSRAPEPPRVEVITGDLVVQLSWEDYQPPGDAVAYRVYGAIVTKSDPSPKLDLLEEIPIEGAVVREVGDQPVGGGRKRFVDREFVRDGTEKEYLVTVLDKFGVESPDTPENRRRAVTPNLPPAPIDFWITNVTTLGPGLLQVELGWNRAPEPDVAGYNIYSSDLSSPTGWRLRKTIKNRSTNTAILTEESIIIPDYFVTAFDNTNREDGGFDQVYPPGFFEAE